jgi:hypothetical protein
MATSGTRRPARSRLVHPEDDEDEIDLTKSYPAAGGGFPGLSSSR